MTELKRKFSTDVVLNMTALTVPFVVLQFVALPLIARQLGSEQYGLIVTYISLFNLISAAFGNVVNNIRLINERNNWKGYNLVLLLLAVINMLIICAFSINYDGINLVQIFLNMVVGTLWYLKEYLIVSFRITIKYFQILISNTILAVGYLVGLALFWFTGIWQLIYIIGFMLCIIYIMFKSDIWKEKIVLSSDFQEMSVQTIQLLFTTVLCRIPVYADKMIIYPLLGAKETSILYITSLSGKFLSFVTTPLSGVLLSYLTKSDKKSRSLFGRVVFISATVGGFCYILCLIICRPLLNFFYPDYVKDALIYIPVVTATVIVTALIGVVNPFLLSYFDLKWQIVIGLIYILLYFSLSITLLHRFALFGFCVGTLISESVRLVFSIFVFYVFEEKRMGDK